MRAAIGFIGAAGTLHDHRRLAAGSPQPDESTKWARAQDRGSALYLLCASYAVEAAETLINLVRHLKTQPDGSHNNKVLSSQGFGPKAPAEAWP